MPKTTGGKAKQGAVIDGNRTSASSLSQFRGIDHIAIAVLDLEASIEFFRDVLGFELKCRFHIKGRATGMLSAELETRGIRFVLCQGTEPTSQVSELVRHHGVGVAHIALEVDDVDAAVEALKSRGLGFDTRVIRGPGLTQAFSSRSIETGLSFEIIHRGGETGFLESNVQQLFDQLEQSGKY
ncbi:MULTISPECIES: VOC family protein [unclassified Bradyrhizobium]|uniref:VOC family protein n=1 Tax=unclassified Bradyrhizobium TaxID=2631580 RepID=UPI0003716A97|nr:MULTISPECIES: VOC family protein [unclassified Bradyrhizobium]MCK1353282.1 VOC family protein [Bradyrhizobium sp. CW7]MCK1418090.1 VOC family protein [Bradyrhizobium sp. CW4]MCK1574141.1 VOC family protein [Bradyrhizobium sp. 174]MCK1713267.1 VOC family protein [Bradyrhizobium sp. 143]UPJ26786.1 VOC family protein [Bradyrhizobium sp. CW1]